MADIVMPTIRNVLTDAGLTAGGRTQIFLTNEAMRLMNPFVPFRENGLRSSARVVDNGTAIEYQSPYAHYQYMGVLYVDPKYNKGAMFNPSYGYWSRPGINKIKTDRKLKYKGGGLSGAKWDEKMMNKHGDELVKSVQKFMEVGL